MYNKEYLRWCEAVGEEYGVVREKQALENLIKGYRESEESLDSSRKANELLNKLRGMFAFCIYDTKKKKPGTGEFVTAYLDHQGVFSFVLHSI